MILFKEKIKKILEGLKKQYYLKILKRKYYRLGKCDKCGCCCENIYVWHKSSVIKTQEEFEEIKKVDSYSFYQHIKVVGKDDFGLIFECEKFDKVKRICKEHKKRPSICKNYPSEQIFSFGAQLQEKCGYRFEPIEKFSEIYAKICKKPPKNFETLKNNQVHVVLCDHLGDEALDAANENDITVISGFDTNPIDAIREFLYGKPESHGANCNDCDCGGDCNSCESSGCSGCH